MVVDNKATVSYIRVLKEDLAIFHIKPNEGQVPDFKPGQFVTLGLNVPKEGKVIRRAYSIASPPEQKKHFELVGSKNPYQVGLRQRCLTRKREMKLVG